VAAVAVAGLSAALGMTAPVETMTVGQLSVRLARSLGARLSPTHPESSAAAFLGRHGLMVGGDLSRPVLGSDLILIGRSLGASVATNQPAAPASPAQVVAFVGAVRGSVVGAQSNGNGQGASKEDGINASCRGREARDGRNGTPASPANPNATAPPCDGDGGEPTP
jgi:hypothetical protein